MHDGAFDRWLLLGAKRDDLLSLAEVQRYGEENFGDPDYLCLYGLRPREWFAHGVRISGRTAVECTRDVLAGAMGRDVAALALGCPLVIDLFAGSANTLYWLKRHTGASRAVGFELDATVFALTSANLPLVGADVELVHDSYDHGLHKLRPIDGPLIVFVAPPWGRALGADGLDLGHTTPPAAEVVDVVCGALSEHQLVFAIQVFERMRPDALAHLTARFTWSQLTIYYLGQPGQNHGLLLGTIGWIPP